MVAVARLASMRLPLASSTVNTLAQRHFTTSKASVIIRAARPCCKKFELTSLQQTFRRSYIDSAPAKKPKFRRLKWLWRLTYLSAIVGIGRLAYDIYVLRHPNEQFEPGPDKKTLVILGTTITLN